MKTLLTIAIISATLFGQTAFSQDVTKGEKIFKKCKACHKIGEGAKNTTGPQLNDIIGRTIGSVEGFKYSKSMKAANELGTTWDQDNLAEYIADPKAYLKTLLDDDKAKSKMSFKLKKEQDRKDVAAYVATFSTAVETEEPVEEVDQRMDEDDTGAS